ncbi:hypothetical protein GB937_007638 [Aspergillus fischeri]|nr:hypothetical protein GB937_007638 [Aspergillus fischeri]
MWTTSQPNRGSSTEHTFEYRFIHKANAKEGIDALAAEGFDFYFNFMQGTLDDPVAACWKVGTLSR